MGDLLHGALTGRGGLLGQGGVLLGRIVEPGHGMIDQFDPIHLLPAGGGDLRDQITDLFDRGDSPD